MKTSIKILIIMLIILLLTSCNKYVVMNVYEKTYTGLQEQNAYYDVYKNLHKYDVDSIPLENWMHSDLVNDTISIEQKAIIKIINDKTNYQFIFSKYIYPSVLYYQFVIRYSGKKKDLQK